VRFGTTPEKIELMAARLESRDVSVDVKTRDDGSGTLLDSMASPLPSQEDSLADHEHAERARVRVQAAIAELDPRERLIIELRMMADDPEELSLAELGRKLGVSRERARQLEARAKTKLQRLLTDDFGPPARPLDSREDAPPDSLEGPSPLHSQAPPHGLSKKAA
jgi:RNA polymerase sigma-32 factor